MTAKPFHRTVGARSPDVWPRGRTTSTDERRDDDLRHPDPGDARAGAAAFGCAAFVVTAVVLEVVAGRAANSSVPSWAVGLFPISWPQPARVGWWLAVAIAALGFRLSLARLGLGGGRAITVATVAPFVILAGGVAFGADWATWH